MKIFNLADSIGHPNQDQDLGIYTLLPDPQALALHWYLAFLECQSLLQPLINQSLMPNFYLSVQKSKGISQN